MTGVQYSDKRGLVGWAGRLETTARLLALLALAPTAFSGACSDFGSEIDPLLPDAAPAAGGRPGAGGSGPAVPGTGGSAGGGGANPDAGGAPLPTPDDAAEACPPAATFAIKLVVDVTWTGNSATTAGTGQVRIFNKAALTASGNALGGEVTPCGTELPETNLSGLGRVAAGGSKILIQIPESVWDAPSMPRFPVTGTRASAAVDTAVQIELAAPLGYQPAGELRGPWPESYSALRDRLLDPDGNGTPGYLAAPKPDGGYVLPPTSLGLGGLAPAAERLALVSRNVLTLMGTRSSCDSLAGSAVVAHFDSHVVACNVRGGAACTPAQVDFVDQNRMKYVPKSASFTAARVAAGATCAEVRGAVR